MATTTFYNPSFTTPPPVVDFNNEVLVAYPLPHTLLLTLNRPAKLNTFFTELSGKLNTFLDWADAEPEIWCIVVTGNGRAFSCGGDLEAWLKATQEGKGGELQGGGRSYGADANNRDQQWEGGRHEQERSCWVESDRKSVV